MSCNFMSNRANAVQCLTQCSTQSGSSLNGNYYGKGLRTGPTVFSSAPLPCTGPDCREGRGSHSLCGSQTHDYAVSLLQAV